MGEGYSHEERHKSHVHPRGRRTNKTKYTRKTMRVRGLMTLPPCPYDPIKGERAYDAIKGERARGHCFPWRMDWYGMVRYGTVWYGMVWYGMVRYGMVR